mmetsp:Transcript_83686/g.270803  ORF Transcript_83686/g.270803 Transcript_83686/m.270803 type:complete len:406 (-) Transcript_83686:46-1263(-)
MGEYQDETFEEMERRFESQYEIIEMTPLGEGTYGKVYKARQNRTAKIVAMKKMKLDSEEEGVPSTAIREIALLKELSHENVVKLLDVFCSTNKLVLVFEFVENDLKKYMKSLGRQLSPASIKTLAHQLCRGIEFCHANRILHRDLKPQNLLIDQRLRLKIADFGLARGRSSEEDDFTDYVVTRWYRAPELMLWPAGYFEAVDIWSVGCIHAEILARKPLFPGENHVDMLRRIGTALGFVQERDLAWLPADGLERDGVLTFMEALQLPAKPPQPLESRVPTASEACLDFVCQLLAFDPTRRISAAGALAHAFLAKLSDPAGETTARAPFSWDFDHFEPTRQALKDRVYAECARLHPEVIARDAEWLSGRGFRHELLADAAPSSVPRCPPPSRLPQVQGSRLVRAAN